MITFGSAVAHEIIAGIVFVKLIPCGMEMPDDDGRTKFVEPPNLEYVLVQPDAVLAIVEIKEGDNTLYSGGGLSCSIVHLSGGISQAVRGTAEEIRATLEAAE